MFIEKTKKIELASWQGDGRKPIQNPYLTEKVMTTNEVEDLKRWAVVKEKNCEEKAALEVLRKETERETIKKNNPHLIQGNDRVTGAKNIRKELKAKFPNVKFSVRGESFSGGDSIHIAWTDGPTTEEVNKITDKYNEGNFDGMTDSYNYDHRQQWTEVFGGAKYVQESRHISDSAYQKAAVDMCFTNAVWNPNTGNFDGVDYETSQTLKRKAWNTSL